jgi:hypothetical protein
MGADSFLVMAVSEKEWTLLVHTFRFQMLWTAVQRMLGAHH